MFNDLQNINSARMAAEYLKRPNYPQITVINQDKQMDILVNLQDIVNKMSKASTRQFWAMFIIAAAALAVAIIK